jgi:putative transposase
MNTIEINMWTRCGVPRGISQQGLPRPQTRRRRAAPDLHRPTVEAAECELLAFAESELGRRYPAAVATWERFIPFLAFPPEVRKIIYTTNSIESLNSQLRKIIKNRGHFPTDDAVIKLLWLAIRDIEDKRARARAKEKNLPRDQRNAPHRLVEGATVQSWKQALGALALAYPDRLAPHLG